MQNESKMNIPLVGCADFICEGIYKNFNHKFQTFDEEACRLTGGISSDGNRYLFDGKFISKFRKEPPGRMKLSYPDSLIDELRELADDHEEIINSRRRVEQILLFNRMHCNSEQDFIDLMPMELFDLDTLSHLRNRPVVRTPEEIIQDPVKLKSYKDNSEYIGYLIGLGIIF